MMLLVWGIFVTSQARPFLQPDFPLSAFALCSVVGLTIFLCKLPGGLLYRSCVLWYRVPCIQIVWFAITGTQSLRFIFRSFEQPHDYGDITPQSFRIVDTAMFLGFLKLALAHYDMKVFRDRSAQSIDP